MDFDLSDEQKMLSDQAQRLLAERSPSDRLRTLIEGGAAWDERLWHELGEMGFLGAAIPENYGGSGMTDLDLCVIAEALGRANAAVPFTSSIVLAAEAILRGGSEAQKQKWLPPIASGELVTTFAYAEGPGERIGGPFTTRFDDGVLNGVKWPVPDAVIARIAVVAHASGLALVELDGDGIETSPVGSFDQLRSHSQLQFTNAPAEALGDGKDWRELLSHVFDRAAVLTAFEQIGGADACLRMARNHALGRQIFGRSLASYQATKHKLADISVRIELARSNAYYAGGAVLTAGVELPLAAASARLSALDAFEQAARENLQVHGGMGYTFEADCHFYYRRERLLAVALGSRAVWSDRLIDALAA